ncbi:MAG: cytosine deaminase [Myxococcales bacterium]|nr:cytosine deaminase [Myxococcales bacterium]
MPETLILRNAAIPKSLLANSIGSEGAAKEGEIIIRDLEISDTVITAIAAPGVIKATNGAKIKDLRNRIVFPGFIDSHVHLDKAFTWDRAPNVRGEFWDAIDLLSKDRFNWTTEDLYRRGDFALRCAESHGTVAMRTHLDVGRDFGENSYEAMRALSERWSGRIQLETVSLCGIELYMEPIGQEIAEKSLSFPKALLGGMPQMGPNLDTELDYFFDLAAELGSGVDLHVDENGLAEAECVRRIAKTILKKDFSLPVTCGHVCSLAIQDESRAHSTIDLIKEAGVQIVSLPMCNMYLQGRREAKDYARATPRWRGVTLLHELETAGVPLACASDNVRDAFYAWGDFDMFEVLVQSIRIAHLDMKLSAATRMVTSGPADIMGLKGMGRVEEGGDARLVVFDSKSFNELLARPAQKRELIGFHSDAKETPDYEELHF